MVLAVGKEVFYVEVEEGNLHQVSTATIEYEVACVDVTPNLSHEKSDLVAVSHSIRLSRPLVQFLLWRIMSCCGTNICIINSFSVL